MYYRSRLVEFIVKGIVGLIIGTVLFSITDPGCGFWNAFQSGLFFFGVPLGWHLTGKVIGGYIIGSLPIMIGVFLVRLVAAFFIGTFSYPVVLAYYAVMAWRERSAALN